MRTRGSNRGVPVRFHQTRQDLAAASARESPAAAALLDRLTDGSTRRLTAILAPAGFGKSSLIADWLTTVAHPNAFVSLDNFDNDLMPFTWTLLGAIRSASPDAMVSSVGITSQNESVSPHPCRYAGIGSDDIESEFVIVLDDYQELRNGQIHELMTTLIRNLPRNAHVIISAREDPPLPVAWIRARG